MKYNGNELEEMTPEKWDGKTREMLVWNTEKHGPVIDTIVGYARNGKWLNNIGDECNHCAEIPKEESTQEYNIDEMIKVLNAYKEGKTIEYRYRRETCDFWNCINTQNPDWNWTIFEYRIANEQQTKKTRIMTNKELFKWLAQGNGAMRWSSHERAPVTTQFVYDEYQENYTVASGIIIRGFDEKEWHKPLIEV